MAFLIAFFIVRWIIYRAIKNTFTNFGGRFLTQKQRKVHTHLFANAD